ncbi:MAG: hypothetical protein OZ921_01580 [Sorangiineae bacterium]|nr:hypothetical protein [Sorangiineae bacterium]
MTLYAWLISVKVLLVPVAIATSRSGFRSATACSTAVLASF